MILRGFLPGELAGTCCRFGRNLLNFRLKAMGVSEPLIQASLLGEAIENGPMAVFVADEHGKYVAVNQAACQLLGYSRDELLALRVADVARYEQATAEWTEMLRSGTRLGSSTLTRKDGSTVELSYVAGATTVAGMPVWVSVGASTS
jgi:PAS domain S-box-containing protein